VTRSCAAGSPGPLPRGDVLSALRRAAPLVQSRASRRDHRDASPAGRPLAGDPSAWAASRKAGVWDSCPEPGLRCRGPRPQRRAPLCPGAGPYCLALLPSPGAAALSAIRNCACSRWVCSALAVMTHPARSNGSRQRRELGDLVGLAVHCGLTEHGTSVLIDSSQQVHRLAVATGMPGAPHCLAVYGHRPPRALVMPSCPVGGPQPRLQPRPGRGIQRVSICCFQDAADGGLIRRLALPGQGTMADTESGQDLRRRVRHPFTDRRERPRSGQHRRHGGH